MRVESVVNSARSAAVYAAEISGTDKKARRTAASRVFDEEQLWQARLIRCICGNPFRPASFDRRWRTSDVVGLARAIYEDKALDRLPVLADALMDAGCEDEQVVSHCRCDGPHARGCWVVDLIMGNG